MNQMTEVSANRPLSILIGALGGQGGGVLTEWIVAAATHAGLAAQSTSIPGVAQRTGATTCYLEIFPERLPEGAPEPVFSLYPTPGDVDVIIAGELLEAGRMLEMDYASPERTTLITSTHRLYSIGEKSVAGNGIYPREQIERAAHALTRSLVAFDALAAARASGSEANAVLLGALAALNVLPLTPDDFEAAIGAGGVAVERNLAGFAAGLKVAAEGTARALQPERAWDELKAERARSLKSRGAAFLKLCAQAEAEFAAPLHRTLGEAIARLTDYQDEKYAADFLARVRQLVALGAGLKLTELFARRLAVWMTYEDAIRVAELKTRRARFARIHQENRSADKAVLSVTDYLKPDLDEIYGLLPAVIAAPLARWAERRWPLGRPTIAQQVRTTTVTGFLRLWLLGRLRFLRPSSLRYQREFALLERWQQAVFETAVMDASLACEVVELATVIKGYGHVRRRLSAALARLFDETLTPALARARAAGQGYAATAELLHQERQTILSSEN
jgi:indolepyruvate ferredoxin oxidoreductase beta subunit